MADIDAVLAEALEDIKQGRARTVPDYLKLVPDADRERLEELLAVFHNHQAAAEGPDPVDPQRYQDALELVDRVFSEERGEGDLPVLLTELRRARRIPREELLAGLAERFGLAGKDRKRLQRAYHQLETGQIEGRCLSDRLLEALGSLLKIDPRDLRSAADRSGRISSAPAQAFGRGLGEVKNDEVPGDRGSARQAGSSQGERLVHDLFYGGPDG
ncbi:MAG TPA: hypothetical protein VGW80_06820 [Solirubrobacterales bacterium]|jgi:hypothetical protein|nr:hypothetical protein [Solirubrobacterales bacterium]